MAKRETEIDERVRALAQRFADEMSAALHQTITAEVRSQVLAIVRDATRSSLFSGEAITEIGGDKRIGKKPVPVECPVPGCANQGIRAKRNFCVQHCEQLTPAEMNRLRTAQLAAVATARGAHRTGAPTAAYRKRRKS